MNEIIQADIDRFRNMLQNISISYRHIDEDAIENYVTRIEELLTDRSRSIEEEFSPIACGAFKECYKLNDDFVIKFATWDNCTEQEEILLNSAIEADIAEIFLPTWYCYLESKGPNLLMLDTESSNRWYYDEYNHTYVENDNWVDPYTTCIIIQPCITYTVSASDYIHLPHNHIDYDNCPIVDKNGNKIELEAVSFLCVSSQTWLQDMLNIYGIEFFNRFSQFVKDHDVHDLHTGNIGYYERKDGQIVPVIFDCLSSNW